MRHLRTLAVLLLCLPLAAADAPATTQPVKPPELAGKLQVMPGNIWQSQDPSSPSKWKHEPERLRWCMAQFPDKKATYGEDSFTGVVDLINRPFPQPTSPLMMKYLNTYQTDMITDAYTICGEHFKFLVTIYTDGVPDWSKGQTITVKGPAQFWDFDAFASPKHGTAVREPRDLRVKVNPQLAPPSGYPAPLRLRQMR